MFYNILLAYAKSTLISRVESAAMRTLLRRRRWAVLRWQERPVVTGSHGGLPQFCGGDHVVVAAKVVCAPTVLLAVQKFFKIPGRVGFLGGSQKFFG